MSELKGGAGGVGEGEREEGASPHAPEGGKAGSGGASAPAAPVGRLHIVQEDGVVQESCFTMQSDSAIIGNGLQVPIQSPRTLDELAVAYSTRSY